MGCHPIVSVIRASAWSAWLGQPPGRPHAAKVDPEDVVQSVFRSFIRCSKKAT